MKLKDRPTPGLIDSAQFKCRHNVNDPVVIYFGNSGIIKNCKVIKIHFTESTVSYDVEVKWTHEDQEYENTDRLYNLHSSIVFNPNDFEQGEPPLQKHSNFTVRLKAHVEKCMKKSGLLEKIQSIMSYDDREDILRRFSDSLGDGAIDALKVEGCVQKYIPKQNKES